MRIFVCFLCLFGLLANTHSYAQGDILAQKISLSLTDAKLQDCLDKLESIANITFSFDNSILQDKRQNYLAKNEELGTFLDRILFPEGLKWKLNGDIIVLKKGPPQYWVISGYIEDAETSERLVGVQIFDASTHEGTLTNDDGFFSLRLKTDSVKLIVSMLGYKVYGEKLFLKQNLRRNIRLRNDLSLATVVITDEQQKTALEEGGASVIQLSLSDLDQLPSLMGESDVINLLKLYPGVHGGDGAQGFYVRGGGPDQNLVLMDGATVYNSSHLFGFYSIFNSKSIKNVKLVKGGFPARYGGRLSSVVDIQTRDGSLETFEGEGNLGLVSASLSLSGPIVKEKTSFMFSARRTLLEPYFGVINRFTLPQNGNSLGYSFLDIQGKLQQILGPKDRLLLSGYVGGDKFASGYKIDTSNVVDQFDFNLRWGNILGSLQWRHEWSNQMFSNLVFHGSQYAYQASSNSHLEFANQPDLETSLVTTSSVRDLGLRWSFDLMPDCHQWLRFGLGSTAHEFVPETYQESIQQVSIDSSFTSLSQKKILSLENVAWFEDQVRFGKWMNFNLGLHFSSYIVDSSFFWSLQPRGSVRLNLPKNFGIQASYTQMVQYIHLLSNSGVGLPIDLWVPATGSIPPQRSRQYSLGIDKDFPLKGLRISAEGYYKKMNNLIDYQTGINFLGNTDWQDLVEKEGVGWSYGLELLLQKKAGRFKGWIGYTLSRTDRQFETINFGEVYPYKYDRRHDLSVAMIYEINDHMEFSANWSYGTGSAQTFPEGVYYAPSSPLLGFWDLNQGQDLDVIIDYGSRNNFRLPAFHRLDLNFRVYKKYPKVETFWNFGIFNVYNRRNPYFLFLRADYSENANSPEIKVRKMSLLPILPEVNFGFKF